MARFKVTLKSEQFLNYYVEADNSQEAEEIAWERYRNSNFDDVDNMAGCDEISYGDVDSYIVAECNDD